MLAQWGHQDVNALILPPPYNPPRYRDPRVAGDAGTWSHIAYYWGYVRVDMARARAHRELILLRATPRIRRAAATDATRRSERLSRDISDAWERQQFGMAF
eukprot:6811567-Pyramimonas_sp.AAC.1